MRVVFLFFKRVVDDEIKIKGLKKGRRRFVKR